MKNESVIKEALIENTTRLIGEGGFEKSTTKAIVYDGISVPGIKLNEAYIYRILVAKSSFTLKFFQPWTVRLQKLLVAWLKFLSKKSSFL